MQSTRKAVLEALKMAGQATVNELAEFVGVKTVTVRHHLGALQAEGLVEAEERRQSVGRPAHIYSLTEEAQSLFPQKYHRLVDLLLDQLKKEWPAATVEALITSLADQLADDLRNEFEDLPQEERMARLIDTLAQEGFMAKWQQTDDGLQLVEYHCPYFLIGQRHPEICQIDEVLIRVVLDADVEKEACVLTGDPVCKFVLQDHQQQDVIS